MLLGWTGQGRRPQESVANFGDNFQFIYHNQIHSQNL